MQTFPRRMYRLLLRLHPAAFRNEFAQEMALDFEDALHTFGLGRLFFDATGSLARQWSAHILSDAPHPISTSRPSLLAGNYVTVDDATFSPLELGRGLVASMTIFALCTLTVSVNSRHASDVPIFDTSASAPAVDNKPATHSSNEEMLSPEIRSRKIPLPPSLSSGLLQGRCHRTAPPQLPPPAAPWTDQHQPNQSPSCASSTPQVLCNLMRSPLSSRSTPTPPAPWSGFRPVLLSAR